jgi:ribonuclease HI
MRKDLLASVRRVSVEKGERVRWGMLAALMACLNFLRAQISRASLYLRTLHTTLVAGVRSRGLNGWGLIPRRVLSELLFWWRNISYNTPYAFALRLSQALLTADASERGWGAVLVVGEAHLTAYESFSPKYTSASSNLRETTAVLNALLYFRQVLLGRLVKGLSVRTDNMVTVFNLQRQGASQSLLCETRQIFSLLQKVDVHLMVMHILGVENEVADALGRMDRVGD